MNVVNSYLLNITAKANQLSLIDIKHYCHQCFFPPILQLSMNVVTLHSSDF